MRVIHAELEKTGFKYFAIIEENKAVSGIFQRCSWFVITHKVQFWYIAGKRDCNISETVQIKDLIITTMIMYNTTAALFPGVCVAYEWFVHLHSKWKWRMTGSVCLIVHIKKWAGGGKMTAQHKSNSQWSANSFLYDWGNMVHKMRSCRGQKMHKNLQCDYTVQNMN